MKALVNRAIWAALGSSIAIFVLIFLGKEFAHPILMAPFGASCAILFALPEGPLAQPRNVIGGHFVTALAGLAALHYLPHTAFVTALATGVGVGLMVLTKTIHPPAGANPLVILLSGHSVPWLFLLFPVVTGAVVLVIVASLYHPYTTRAYHHEYLPRPLRKGKASH